MYLCSTLLRFRKSSDPISNPYSESLWLKLLRWLPFEYESMQISFTSPKRAWPSNFMLKQLPIAGNSDEIGKNISSKEHGPTIETRYYNSCGIEYFNVTCMGTKYYLDCRLQCILVNLLVGEERSKNKKKFVSKCRRLYKYT